jgi:hypothetical protein
MRISKTKLKALLSFGSYKKRKMLLLGILLISLLFIYGIVKHYSDRKANTRQNQELVEKLEGINKSGVTCDTVVKEVGDESPDQYELSTQKELLEQQMLCYADIRQLDDAIEAAEKLRDIYTRESNTEEVARIEANIYGWQDSKNLINDDEKNNE